MKMRISSFIVFFIIQTALSATHLAQKPTKPDSTADSPDTNFISLFLEDNPQANALDELFRMNFFGLSPEDGTAFDQEKEDLKVDLSDLTDSLLMHRLSVLNANTPFDLTYNADVRRFIEMYLRKQKLVSRVMGLSQQYFPLFEETFDKNKMPLELKYLAIVESALNPTATSRAGAQGLWQFMYGTGKLMGLEVTSYVDERNDPYKATEASAKFLQQLFDWFGDWNMALAAYNSGPGNVTKAIRRSGGKMDYWEIRPYLPRETQGYVPAFIAVNYVMAYGHLHGIKPLPTLFNYYDTDTIAIKSAMSLSAIAEKVNMPLEHLELLNPIYKLGIIPPPTEKTYFLTLPRDKWGLFLSHEDSLHAQLSINTEDLPKFVQKAIATGKSSGIATPSGPVVKHKVRNGESLSVIAQKHGVSIQKIKQWNNLKNDRIYVGQVLTIHKSGSSASVDTEVNSKPEKIDYHTVSEGDTLYRIAQKYGKSVDKIMEWNQIKNPNLLAKGTKIKILSEG